MTDNYSGLIKGTLGAHQTQQWHYTILSAVHSCMPHTLVGMYFLAFNVYRAGVVRGVVLVCLF